jgi:hypothetical protein
MDDLKQMLIDHKIDQIYKNTLTGIKQISEHLNIWENYSIEEKYKLENLTKSDSNLNKHFQHKDKYDVNLTYSEVLKEGVDILIDKILRYKGDVSVRDVFVDVGSGCGKLSLHMGVKSNFRTIVGIEIIESRHKYANYIKSQIDLDEDKVFLINKDILDFNLEISSVIFINDIYMEDKLVDQIWNKILKGTHVIITKEQDCKIVKETFEIPISGSKKKRVFYYYVK